MFERTRSGSSPLVIVAALNEEEGIGPTIAELKRFLDDPSILVVDGKSIDRTVEIAKDLGADVIYQEGQGKGAAIATALRYVKKDFEYTVFTDADYTYPAECLPGMLKILGGNPDVGMVCGNRFNEHLDLGQMHNVLYFGNRLLAFTHNFLNGIDMRDPLTGLRAVRWEIIRDWRPRSEGFDLEVEFNHLVERKGFEIAEIPIMYRPRMGEKKLKIQHGVTILKRILLESV